MNPGAFVAGGGGDGGGKGGKGGKNGSGDEGAGTGDGDEDASGDGNDGGEGCGDPVCPITGRVFLDVLDFAYNAPRPLRWMRGYNSRTSATARDLGHGWSHDFGWSLKVGRRKIEVLDARARVQRFSLKAGFPQSNALGWTLSRTAAGYELFTPKDRLRYEFRPLAADPASFCLSAVCDLNNNRTEIERDTRGRLTGIVDSAKRPYRVKTDGHGRLVEVSVATDAQHSAWMRVVSYVYDAAGDLVQVVDAEGHAWNYRYVNHLMVEQRTPIGLSYCYRYDGKTQEARCLETWGEYLGAVDPALEQPLPPAPTKGRDNRPVKGIQSVRFDYQPDEYYCESENGRGAITRYFGDAAGRVLRKVMPNGGVYEYFYSDETGALTRMSDPDGNDMEVHSDAQQNPMGFTSPNGDGMRIHVEADGTVVEVDWRNGRVTRRRSDARENPTYVGHADGTWEEYEYDARGLVTAWVDRRGSRTFYQYDAMGNLTSLTASDGRSELSEYDYLGRRTSYVSAEGARTEWLWNRMNEVVWKRQPDGTEISVTYNGLMKPTSIREGAAVWRYEYGGLNWVYQIVNPRGDVTHFRYDVEGNLTHVRNARGQTYTQYFDLENRAIGSDTFEGVRLRGALDLMGRMISCETPDGVTTLSYDAEGQLAGMEYADGESVELAHLVGSGATRIDNSSVLVETWFDGVGQPVREVQGDHEVAIGWKGGRVAVVSPSVGPPLQSETKTDTDVRVTQGSVLFVLNQPSGNETIDTLGQELVSRKAFADNGRLSTTALARRSPAVSLENAAAAADPNRFWWRNYHYGPSRRLVSELHSDGTFIEYEHDAFGQVLSRTRQRSGAVDVESLSYDAAGSPRFPDVVLDSLARPISVGGEIWRYDAEGRLAARQTAEGEWLYRWSTSTNLLEVVTPKHRVEMDYDGRGRRMRKRVFRGDELVSATDYIWSNQVVLREVDRVGGATRTYVRRDGSWEIVGHIDSSASGDRAYLYAHDPSGAVVAAFDEQGRQVFAAERSIYGVYTIAKDELSVTARMVNQFDDPDVGLYYNRFRWYEPRAGMYVSRDPLELEGTLNPRDYVRDPYLWVDPLGLAMAQPPGGRATAGRGHPPRPRRPNPSTMSTDDTHTYLTAPGYNATNGTEAVPGYVVADDTERTGRGFRAGTTATVDAAGDAYGCHSCGRSRAQVEAADGSFGHWRKDHQPPLSHVAAGDAVRGNTSGVVRIYPHCPRCSNTQGGGLASRPPTAAEAARAAAIMAPRAADGTRRGPPRR